MLKQSRINWFEDLKRNQFNVLEEEHGVLVELRIDQLAYDAIKFATEVYLRACAGHPVGSESEQELLSYLESNVDQLANRTPNGIVIPKKEFESEFNDLHRTLAVYVRSLGLDDSIYRVSTPIIVRLVKGSTEADVEDRPYASSKIHIDPWGGDPGDEVVVSIPVLGDIARTTVEYYEPPNELEIDLIRTMDNYEQGQKIMGEVRPISFQQRIGYSYFMDAVVPHRTVKSGGLIRVTVEFRLRRKTSEEERILVEEVCDTGRLSHFVDVSDWHKLGSTKRMRFSDTNADAKKGIFVNRPYDEPIYTTVDIPPEIFD